MIEKVQSTKRYRPASSSMNSGREFNMEKLKIAGGYPLKGTIKVSGAKNSAVALIPATILADSPVTIEGLPDISDVRTLKDLFEEIGGKVELRRWRHDG